jgi:hypothetical protein
MYRFLQTFDPTFPSSAQRSELMRNGSVRAERPAITKHQDSTAPTKTQEEGAAAKSSSTLEFCETGEPIWHLQLSPALVMTGVTGQTRTARLIVKCASDATEGPRTRSIVQRKPLLTQHPVSNGPRYEDDITVERKSKYQDPIARISPAKLQRTWLGFCDSC